MLARDLAFCAFSLVAIATRSATYHAIFAVAGLAYQVFFIVRQFEVL